MHAPRELDPGTRAEAQAGRAAVRSRSLSAIAALCLAGCAVGTTAPFEEEAQQLADAETFDEAPSGAAGSPATEPAPLPPERSLSPPGGATSQSEPAPPSSDVASTTLPCSDPGGDDADDDDDGTPNCDDQCPEDPKSIEPGLCGCGVEESDRDEDGTPDWAGYDVPQ